VACFNKCQCTLWNDLGTRSEIVLSEVSSINEGKEMATRYVACRSAASHLIRLPLSQTDSSNRVLEGEERNCSPFQN
jgi:hypothetical protein